MPTCRQIMTPDPDFCLPDTNLVEIARLMKSKNIGSVPVIQSEDSRELIGIVTDRDLVVRAIAEEKEPKLNFAQSVMTAVPRTCSVDDDIQMAIELMETEQIRRIPVVNESGKLLGIISQADVAIRMHKPKSTSELLEEISKPEILARELKRKAG